MSFRTLKRKIFANRMASTDYFGEAVTVQPPDGAARAIRAKATLTGSEMDNRGLAEMERLEVLVALDETTTDAAGTTVGGIGPNPPRGYRLWREADVDPDRRPFIFRGHVIRRGRDSQKLLFERPHTTTHSSSL